MENINNTFFDGYYKDIWKMLIPDELTVKEIDFILSYFNLQPGSRVLDLMCGYGRHAIGLARKGMEVTAVDNLPDYIAEIKETADREELPLRVTQADVLNYKPGETFDLVICMGNSINFFNATDTHQLLSQISPHLKTGGHLLINSWSLAEIVIKNFKERGWNSMGDLKFLTDARFLFHPTRIETESTIIAPDGTTEIKRGVDYIFSINEIDALLQANGMVCKEIFSIPGKKKFSIGEPRAYIVVEKNTAS